MLHKQGIATIAILAIVLAIGAAAIVTMIPQAYADGENSGDNPRDLKDQNRLRACEHKPAGKGFSCNSPEL